MIKKSSSLLIAIVLVFSFISPSFANAASLNQAGVRLGRLGISASTNNDLLVTFKLNTTPTSVARIQVTFPVGFTVATGTPTVGTTGFPATPASITAAPGSLTAAATAGSRTILVSGLTSASLNNTTLYGFTIPSGTVTNPATAGQYAVTVESQNSGGTQIDSTMTPVYIYGATANNDQVTVSASVAPNFSFTLSATTDTIPRVDPTTTSTSPGVTMTVGTNSPLGYTAYVKSANGQLTSATSPATPITNGTFDGTVDSIVAGTTKYGFVPSTGTACSTCTGTLSYDTEYQVSTGAQVGAFNGTGFASFVSRNGYTNADAILLRERIAVSNTVGYANDYTDTLTIVAAGNF
jgi:hypothetical protein